MSNPQQRQRAIVLLVEDRPDDVALFKRALAMAGIATSGPQVARPPAQ